MLSLQEIKNGVAAAAREFPIKKAELFGSYANGSNTPDSDVDLLVEFTVPRISLITLNQMKYRLEEILSDFRYVRREFFDQLYCQYSG